MRMTVSVGSCQGTYTGCARDTCTAETEAHIHEIFVSQCRDIYMNDCNIFSSSTFGSKDETWRGSEQMN
jgi:hypothetical protein